MGLIKEIEAAFLQAMKQRNEAHLPVLRMLKSGLKNKAIELMKKELDEAEVIAVVKSEIKKRKDSVDAYTQGNRLDLADKEAAEIKVLEKFLPAQLAGEALNAKVRKIIAGLSDEEKQNFGQVMGKVMAELKGAADGGAVMGAVKAALGK